MTACVEAVSLRGHFGGDKRYQTEANYSVRSQRSVDHGLQLHREDLGFPWTKEHVSCPILSSALLFSVSMNCGCCHLGWRCKTSSVPRNITSPLAGWLDSLLHADDNGSNNGLVVTPSKITQWAYFSSFQSCIQDSGGGKIFRDPPWRLEYFFRVFKMILCRQLPHSYPHRGNLTWLIFT